MKICIIRHGETDWNIAGKLQGREDIPLNETGAAQARDCASALAGANGTWAAVYTSPLSRAVRTAEIIAAALNVPVIADEALTERDFGKSSGLTYDKRNWLFPDGGDGSEDMSALRERMYNAVKTIADKHYPDNVIIVSHGGSINALLAELSNGEIGSGKTILKNACMNILAYDGGAFEIECYNKTSEEL